MIRLLVAFVVLFIGAIACVSLLPNPAKIIAPPSAVAAQPQHDAAPATPQSNVRIVYPAPDHDATQDRPLRTEDIAAAPVNAAATAPAVDRTAVYPQVQPITPTATPPNEAAQAGAQGVNLNTASIEALNQIPGAGHIGRMIASHRPYRSVEDLLTKRVVRKSVYDPIKDQVAAE